MSETAIDMTQFKQNFIGGKRVDPLGSDVIEVHSPYDGKLIGSTPAAAKQDVDLAVSTARAAFDRGPWPRMTPAERAAILARFAERHAARAQEFAAFISSENGSPLWFTSAVQQGIAAQNGAYLETAARYPWEIRQDGLPAGETVWRQEPVGVVAAIIPWNAPHQSALVKLFPALLVGCTVILKLAPETALDGQFLGELFTEAGVPEGVVSVLAADRDVSEYLVAHPGVDKIAFTGSSATGKRIASLAGEGLKRVSLELGGKSAAIVLPDADIASTIGALRYAAFPNAGQSCGAQTRILVARAQHDLFVDALAADVAAMRIGDPGDPQTFMGPLVSERQRRRVADYIELGIAEGAIVAAGGPGMPAGIGGGAFVRPTVFAQADNAMRIAREEIFGPVVCVIPYDSIADAIRIANDSVYGLSGSVWTSDPEQGLCIARQIRTGTLFVNQAAPDFLSPFGGYKQSGIGREFGAEGIHAYVEHKAIRVGR
jgi:acyl-CoA reductase-like NAD-dependent aldehyde dehydrogenase